MGKTLTVVRHAKSDWSFQVRDIDRPLNDRGFSDAPKMADRLKQRIGTPDLLVSSPAKRALTTAQLFAEHFAIPTKSIAVLSEIYDASTPTLLQAINGFDNTYDSVVLFGHNPGLSDLVTYLSDTGEIVSLPTCSFAVVQFDNDNWAEITGGLGTLQHLEFPKNALY